MPHRDSTDRWCVRGHSAEKLKPIGLEAESAAFSESLHAVVDHDDDRAHGHAPSVSLATAGWGYLLTPADDST
jgi:hypothetical protein